MGTFGYSWQVIISCSRSIILVMCEVDWELLFKGVQTVVALFVAGAGLYGFKQWKKQLRGTDQYNTAKEILKALLHLQELIESSYSWLYWLTTDPVTQQNFQEQEGEIDPDSSLERSRSRASNAAIFQHMAKLREAFTLLRAESSLGRFILGESLGEYIVAIQKPINSKLSITVRPLVLQCFADSFDGSGPEFPDQDLRDEIGRGVQALETKLLEFSHK